jgi:hypothetical protein
MSYSTLFGAYVVPQQEGDPIGYVDASASTFHCGSRSGAFHAACRSLLDSMPGHEGLRFLSAQSATHEDTDAGGRTTFSVLDQASSLYSTSH